MDPLDELRLRGLPVTLRQLQVFLAVCSEGGFSRAGERLGLTQPAVSAQVRQLERAVGRQLVEFVGRNLWLTEEGELMRATARDVLARLETARMTLDDMAGRLRGPLRLAVVSSAQYFVPHLLAAFLEQHPGVEIRQRVTNRYTALDRVEGNADDLAIMALVPEDRALELTPFLDNELHLIAHVDHAAAAARSLEALADTTFLMREPGSGIRRALEDEWDRRGMAPPPQLEFGSIEAMREGVRAGLGVALLPRHGVYRDLAAGTLVSVPARGFPIRRTWCLVHARGKALNPAARAMMAFVRDSLATLPQRLEAALTAAAPARSPGGERTAAERS